MSETGEARRLREELSIRLEREPGNGTMSVSHLQSGSQCVGTPDKRYDETSSIRGTMRNRSCEPYD